MYICSCCLLSLPRLNVLRLPKPGSMRKRKKLENFETQLRLLQEGGPMESRYSALRERIGGGLKGMSLWGVTHLTLCKLVALTLDNIFYCNTNNLSILLWALHTCTCLCTNLHCCYVLLLYLLSHMLFHFNFQWTQRKIVSLLLCCVCVFSVLLNASMLRLPFSTQYNNNSVHVPGLVLYIYWF